MAYALDIHSLLAALDRREFEYYAALSEAEKKGFKPIVVLRWLSAISGQQLTEGLHLFLVNEIVNQNFHDISDHPELQYKLMASVGGGAKARHDWIAMPKSGAQRSLIHEFLQELHPSANDFEIDVAAAGLSRDRLATLINDLALPADRSKALLDAHKKTKQG